MRRIEAFAVIFETTPNAVIREGCNFYLTQQVGTPGYDEALAAYHRRTTELAGVLDQIRRPGQLGHQAPEPADG